ncbi:phosphoglycerate mutase-like protein [Calocera viscosa TUFC12733]|uniref:Phosphoglycerate mutase-like protein n=1 Tax=Calocera viscosa (strain TUFC12733) TaxID=1330018 RepID=A0A167LV26_CALVF|nr:phosphoglycerate mutase-like protein [Calocera viscosa TUFC12733]
MRAALLSAVWLSTLALARAFNPLHHSGPAAPYFDAPSQAGIPKEIPEGCVVDQAAYVVRHGARYPEPGSYTGWVTLYNKLQNSSTPYNVTGPLAFLKTWVPPVDDPAHMPLYLSGVGALESFQLGVQLRNKYKFTPGGGNLTVWSAAQERVLATAANFLRGYLAQGSYVNNATLNRGAIVSMPDSVNWTSADSLTFTNGCPNYSNGDQSGPMKAVWSNLWQPRVAARLNSLYVQGELNFTASDVSVMGDLCGFSAEVDGDTRFCDILTPDEWLDYEYGNDLNYYYGSGPGNPYAGTSAWPLVKAITDLLVAGPGKTTGAGTFTPAPLIMSFTHDNDLPPVIAALGLWNSTLGVYPLSNSTRSADRDFRSSYLVSFRGYVALERLNCTTPSGSSQYVRVQANSAPIPIPGCVSGPGSSCPLAQFAQYVSQDRLQHVGEFVSTCNNTAANATQGATLITLGVGDLVGEGS